jgi:hypothetical protein
MTRQPQKASSLNNQLLGKCGGVHSWEQRKKMEEQSTLSWALSYFAGIGSTIVIAHVPSQMIPVSRCRSFFLASHPIPSRFLLLLKLKRTVLISVGGKFHASKLSPEQVTLFRWAERGKGNKMLNGYVHQCSKMKVTRHLQGFRQE